MADPASVASASGGDFVLGFPKRFLLEGTGEFDCKFFFAVSGGYETTSVISSIMGVGEGISMPDS